MSAAMPDHRAPPVTRFPALKEWSPIVSALEDGTQTIIIRKGGLREPVFKPQARRFYLFPTKYHIDHDLLKPEVRDKYQTALRYDPKQQSHLEFTYISEITGAWTTCDPSILEVTNNLHVYGKGFLDTRLRWRAQQPLTVLELRVYHAETYADDGDDSFVARVLNDEKFYGCFSWVGLEGSFASAATDLGAPVLDDVEFEAKQRSCREGISHIKDLKELDLTLL